MSVKLYEVGGCVRDSLLGLDSKDVDFVVIADSFDAMRKHIVVELGLKIYLEKEEFVTIRAGVPKGHFLRERCKDADFVMARKDGPSSDGRRPDFVEPGTILDDLERRDFTINAIAKCVETGKLLDPHGGITDLKAKMLCFVGDGEKRIKEDALRILRGVRFSITKGFTIDDPALFNEPYLVNLLSSVSTDRVREELNKMFTHNTLATLQKLEDLPNLRHAVFSRPGLRLSATTKG